MINWFCALLTIFSYYGFSQTEYHYLVKFKNKSSDYSINHPEEYLSAKSLIRRAAYQVDIDSSDLPINLNYIDSIKKYPVTIQARSKWHNCLVVSSNLESINDSLNSYSFVKSIALIGETVLNKKNNDKLDYGFNNSQIEAVNVNLAHNSGYTGKGVEIAVIDAGFSELSNNTFFDSLFLNNQIKSTHNFITNKPISYSSHYHGTNVLSVLGANISGRYVGTSPGSKYHLLVSEDINQENKIEEFHLIEALEYCDSAGIDVINISLGYSDFDDNRFSHSKQELTGDSTLLSKACNMAWRNGAFIVTSAGNNGNDTWGTVTVPANSDSVLSVGAVSINNNYASFSSKGNPSVNSTLKPNVVGVGSQVYIVKEDGTIGISSGTSFSSPQIAGLTSCLMEAFPKRRNWEIKKAIEYSGDNSFYPDSLRGHGIPDFQKAHRYLSDKKRLNETKYITIYPNPSNGIFHIIHVLFLKELNVFDTKGKNVLNMNLNSKTTQLNLAHLNAGIYFLQAKHEKGLEVIKIEVL